MLAPLAPLGATRAGKGECRKVRNVLRVCCLACSLIACRGATAPSTQSAAPAAREGRPEGDPPGEPSHAARPGDERRSDPASADAATAPPPADGRAARTVGVRGITGSLTAFEVEQAMNARTSELLACVKQRRPRSLGHVAGDITFHIALDGAGKVEEVAIVKSDIGHGALEECLAGVVASAPFPVPAGAERAETQWHMTVEPLHKAAERLENAALEETFKHEAAASYESCQIAKGRRFEVTGYLAAKRKLQPVSVRVPWRAKARTPEVSPEQLSCLSEALQHWTHWPKARGHSKLSFELRWVPAPPPKRHVRPARKGRKGR